MNTQDFLARVIPPGNYLIIPYNKEPWHKNPKAWGARAYTGTDYAEAAGFVQWCSSKGFDTYHALASYRLAQAETETDGRGRQKLRAERRQSNVQAIKTLILDLDGKRPGDDKPDDKVFPTRMDALKWLTGFCGVTNLPRPNLLVSSGWGLHAYWLFDAPLAREDWQPLADALKAAAMTHGFTGDLGPTVDAARILRPPGARNYKGIQGNPGQPVEVIDAVTAADYPLAQLQTALTPWIAQTAAGAATGGLAGAISIGARPSFMNTGPAPQTNQAASANIPTTEYLFANIAQNCKQVQTSLANHGAQDSRDLWYLGHLTLAHFCQDGRDFAHNIGSAHPKYSVADTDAALKQIETEVLSATGIGAPKCTSFNGYRRNICPNCPWWGRLSSPIGLGRPDGDLPRSYRRNGNVLERLTPTGKKDDDGKPIMVWRPLIDGDVYGPRLEELAAGGYAINFTYALAGSEHPVRAAGADVFQPLVQGPVLEKQGIPLDRKTAGNFGDFLVAWITKLRQQRAQKGDIYRPFGWCFSQSGDHLGLAIAGTLYRTDGTLDAVPGGDAKLNAIYRPSGTLANWRKAAALFEGPRARVDLQAILAISFGSPLMALVGDVRGMSWHFWSVGSAIGKSTMMKLAQAVWGGYPGMSTMEDTINAFVRTLAGPRVLPRLWDEARLKPGQQETFANLVYSIPQGREKARLTAQVELRETGEWETMVVFTSNKSLMDVLIDHTEGTDSGVARLFEAQLPQGDMAFSADAGKIIKLLENNYGHAGRAFAAYVASNLPQVQAEITALLKAITKQWQVQPVERFYAAGITAALVGAKIAKQLGLFDFDPLALYNWLGTAFMQLRVARGGQSLLTKSGATDIEQALSAFTYDNMDYRLVTGIDKNGKTEVKDLPRSNEVRWQIYTDQKLMRISLTAFRDWMKERLWSASAIIKEMETQWGVVSHRKTIGAGTRYRGGQLYVIDIPLTLPALAVYLPDQPNPQAKGQAL